MRALRRFLKRLVASLGRRRDDDRLRQELDEHLQLLTEDLERSGLTRGEARRRARLKLGSTDATAEAARDEQRLRLLENAWRDTRLACRQLWRAPTFSGAVVATLAIALGATSRSSASSVPLSCGPCPSPNPIDWFISFASTRGEARRVNRWEPPSSSTGEVL
jgi:hypothetical protein